MLSRVESLETSLVWKLAGSSSTRPSRLPRMLVENQPFKPKQRRADDGGETALHERLSGFEVLAAMGIFVFSASSHMAGMSTVVLGAPITKGAPSAKAA